MRRILLVGFGFTLSMATLLAQAPGVKLGQAVPVEPAETVIRGAAPDLGVTPLFKPRPAARQPASPLPPPKPLEGTPNVTETRNPGAGTTPVIPGTVVSPQPFPGIPVGPQTGTAPVITGPVIGQSYPYTHHAAPPMNTGGLIPSPIHPEVPCPPGSLTASPAAPAAIAADGGFVEAPRLGDPYWGLGDPLFPRVRQALNNTIFSDRLTLSGEYLLWFVRAQSLPPLLTTSSPANNGIIGQGDTRVIYGNVTPTDTRHSGARFGAMYRLNDTWALDGNVWFLGRNGSEFRATSDQYPVLARPFFNVNSNSNFSQLITSPGLSTGSASVISETSLWGAEINARRGLLCLGCNRIDALVGFRYLNLSESLQITENFQRTANSNTGIGVPNVAGGTVIDRFRTENHFYGVNLGLAGEMNRGWWFVQGRATVGLGSINQVAELTGSQALTTTAGGVINANGGLLVLPGANAGRFSRSQFGVVPDIGLTVGLNLTERLRFGVGYNFIYMNSVVRPAGQIDTGLDVTRIPNFPITPTPTAISGVRPATPILRTSDFFAQGITFSLMWTW
jgi:Putative beta barrel porin-7 (BBP7)